MDTEVSTEPEWEPVSGEQRGAQFAANADTQSTMARRTRNTRIDERRHAITHQ
jgi:hypothetical protein